MRSLILTAAVLFAGFAMSEKATAAGPHHQPGMNIGGSHAGAALTLVGHHGHSYHGRPNYGPPHHGYRSYHHHGYHAPYIVAPPVYVRPPVVVPYPYRYGYRAGYGYYHGGVSVNTGRLGFSFAF